MSPVEGMDRRACTQKIFWPPAAPAIPRQGTVLPRPWPLPWPRFIKLMRIRLLQLRRHPACFFQLRPEPFPQRIYEPELVTQFTLTATPPEFRLPRTFPNFFRFDQKFALFLNNARARVQRLRWRSPSPGVDVPGSRE
jgi:hypothetical protein